MVSEKLDMNITIKHNMVENTGDQKLSHSRRTVGIRDLDDFFPSSIRIIVTEKSVTLSPGVRYNGLKLKHICVTFVVFVIRKMQIKPQVRYH